MNEYVTEEQLEKMFNTGVVNTSKRVIATVALHAMSTSQLCASMKMAMVALTKEQKEKLKQLEIQNAIYTEFFNKLKSDR